MEFMRRGGFVCAAMQYAQKAGREISTAGQ
jgi:hypothetical protein